MSQDRLRFHLDKVAARYRDLRFWQFLALVWLAASLLGTLLWIWTIRSGASPLAAAALLCTVPVLLAAIAFWWSTRSARNYEWVAHQIETAFPELRTCLIAAVEQKPDLPEGRFGYLQASVIRQALEHASRNPWPEAVPRQSFALAGLANLVTFLLFAAALVALVFNVAGPLAAAASSSSPAAAAVAGGPSVTIEPGSVEIEKGMSLLVLARVQGPLPSEATLVYRTDADVETRLPMNSSLEDPVFGGRIPIVEEPLGYHVEIGGQTTESYRVTVFEYPRLERADAQLTYPEYTGMEPRLVQDVRTVSVVEGTQLKLRCLLNKEVASATLVDTRTNVPTTGIVLNPSTAEPLVYEANIACDQSRKLRLDLVDDAGRKNVKPYQFSINVLPNQPPSLKLVFPSKDLEVSALEELDVKATVWDDFGVQRMGLTYALAGGEPVDVVIQENIAAKQKYEAATVIRLEELQAEPDQLLAYHWWSEDHGPDGQIRRTMSDMYFAEVRPFEEIYRQGQQPPGGQQQQQNRQGQGQNAQQAQELARLQKEIINATWKLVRREAGSLLTEAFIEDAEQVHLSQASALEQARQLADRVQDEQSKQFVDEVLNFKQAALDELKKAFEVPSAAPLKPALASEQSAYQSLLKLRAREHEVVRQQQQQGQQSSRQSSSRSQQQEQQLQQLDLKQEENRYETQRTAEEQQQESAQDRENRQVLNRLRELARRQHDLNERLKELQSSLEEARSEQQKEEIRKQLQRLQDEQRQILQDTDELQARLEQPENAERMSQERQQLEETRDQVRRASEALEQQQITKAAASGTRAEQQFDELREEFRRRAANRFSEEMQQMRQAARELDENEQKLAEQIKEASTPQEGVKSLNTENPREKIADEIGQQRQRLTELQDRMRETIDQAQETEPLLTDRLYETARDIQERKLEQSLEAAERSLRQGLQQDARDQEARASEGIRQVREGIERAAEGVLGDETEALRRAREELRELSEQLNEEIGQRDGNGEPEEGTRDQGPGTRRQETGEQEQTGRSQGQPGELPPQGKGQPGEQQGEQPQPGKGQPGEQQGEQQQPGGQQPGGQQPGGQQSGQQQPGEQGTRDGERESGAQPGEEPRGRQARSLTTEPPRSERRSSRESGRRTGGVESGSHTGGLEDYMQGEFAPITGENFREWSDRLRDVEEMVEDPELRAEAARIRERAREFRADLKRHSQMPQWDVLRDEVAKPLSELQQRISEELLRRTTKNALVPLDRDPVPPQYSEKTRRYYERLGIGASSHSGGDK